MLQNSQELRSFHLYLVLDEKVATGDDSVQKL